MSDDYVIDAFGARWNLETGDVDPPAAERLRVLWAACRVVGGRSGDDGVEPFVISDPDPYAVSRAITLASLGRRRGSAVLLHAAGLEQDGRAAALVGRSGAGKSTAALTLGRHFGYLSDETVAVEADGRVSAYPKPVSVVTDPSQPFDKHEEAPAEAGLRTATATAYLRVVLVLDRDSDHESPQVAQLPLIDALLAIIPQSSSLPAIERPLARLAELVSQSGGPFALRYREIGDCVGLVAELLQAPPERDRAPWTTTPGGDVGVAVPEGSVVRAPWRDALHGDGGTIVLIDENVVRLGPVGEAIWLAAAAPATTGDLHESVVAALGPHPDSAQVVAAAVTSLLEAGVLRD